MIVYGIIGIFFAILTGQYAKHVGRNIIGWAALALIFNVFALGVLVAIDKFKRV